MKTVWGANCDLPTIGSVRLALEPKPGLPTDPDDPRAFIDIFTDIRGLFVINNESGWYEGWMIHDLRVAPVAPPDGRATPRSARSPPRTPQILRRNGDRQQRPAATSSPSTARRRTSRARAITFPDHVTNVVPIQLSMGAYNALQQSDAHSYWEFNYTTNWIHPLYELPFTGGFPDTSPTQPADTFQDGEIGALQSIVPGDGPGENRDRRRAVAFGDNPDRPRDPDLFDSDADAQREFRERFIPSGIAHEVFLNVFERLASFEPGEHDLTRRLFDGYEAAVALVDTNGDGIISAAEGDIDTPNPNCPTGRQHLPLPAAAELQPLRGHARDQRRLSGAALRAQHARLGAVGHHRHRVPGHAAAEGRGLRRPLRASYRAPPAHTSPRHNRHR